MGTPKKHYSFLEVYTSCLSKIQDNHLRELQKEDFFLFCEKMYRYMLDGITEYVIPSSMYAILSDRIDTEYIFDEVILETETDIVTFPDKISVPDEITLIRIKVDGKEINVKIDIENKTIQFNELFPIGTNILFENYIIGKFNEGLSDRQVSILASWTAYIWALQVSNNEEDITRLLLDTDFKMANEGTVTKAKVDWLNSYYEKAYSLMNSNDWGYTFLSTGIDKRNPMQY